MSDSPDLQALVQQLVERVGQLEEEVAVLRSAQTVPDDVMVAISAAVSAFLGHKAKVRAVHFAAGRAWAQEGRGRVHNRQVLHVR